MKNLLTVLKKLGKKMTDQDITGTNLVTVVDDIANKYTGGGGSGGSGSCDCTLVVGMTIDETMSTLSLDKTWQEIYDALVAGKHVIINDINLDNFVSHTEINSAYIKDGAHIVETINGTQLVCATPSDYPSTDDIK